MPLSPGTKLGPYEIVAPLGAGGMGEVYRAQDSRLNRQVAIKVLPGSFSSDAERLRRFQQEAMAAAALNDPDIVAVHDVGTQGDFPYVVSELLEGETLRDRLRNGALSRRRSVEYGTQMARALAAAHEKGIVHRDLMPENIFITREGRMKILDFGLAKLMRQEEAAAAAGQTTHRGYHSRHRARYGRLHGAGAGSRFAGRRPFRHLRPRRDSLRDAVRAAGLPGRHGRRHDERHSEGRPARTF